MAADVLPLALLSGLFFVFCGQCNTGEWSMARAMRQPWAHHLMFFVHATICGTPHEVCHERHYGHTPCVAYPMESFVSLNVPSCIYRRGTQVECHGFFRVTCATSSDAHKPWTKILWCCLVDEMFTLVSSDIMEYTMACSMVYHGLNHGSRKKHGMRYDTHHGHMDCMYHGVFQDVSVSTGHGAIHGSHHGAAYGATSCRSVPRGMTHGSFRDG